jgi:hypothetical protein
MDDPIWLTGRIPKDFWKNPEHRRWFMGWLGEQLGFHTPEDWYALTAQDFQTYRGGKLLAEYYRNSPIVAVKRFFPKYAWKEWLFESLPADFWVEAENRRRYLEWLGIQLEYHTPADWYQLTIADFQTYHGADLLHTYYHNSPAAAVREYFPDEDWQDWLFRPLPSAFWEDIGHRRQYLAWLGKQLGYQTKEEWHQLTTADFTRYQGADLLRQYYQGSPVAAVREYFPDNAWYEWLFGPVPSTFWAEAVHRRQYLVWLGAQLGYQTNADWYGLTAHDFVMHHGQELLDYYQQLPFLAVLDVFSEETWRIQNFTWQQQRQQQLVPIVTGIFSRETVQTDVNYADVRLDTFLPALNVAIICQGPQDVLPRAVAQTIAAVETLQQQAETRRVVCQQHDIVLIEIPSDWDGQAASAVEFITRAFITQMNSRVNWTEPLRAAWNTLHAYHRRQQRITRKQAPAAYSTQLDFL